MTLDGEDIYEDYDVNLLRRQVGMVFQKPNPFPMSIYDNIAYGPIARDPLRAKLNEIVEQSLRDAAIWDEVRTGSKRTRSDSRAASSSAPCALPARSRSSRPCC